jgi:hypothetical protein
MRKWTWAPPLLRLAVAALLLTSSAGAASAIRLDGSCISTSAGGSPWPKAPREGACDGEPSALHDAAGGMTTAAEGGAMYTVQGSHGHLGFDLSVSGGTRRDLLQQGEESGSYWGYAGADLHFDDSLQVASTTLPAGTEVDLTWSGTIHAVAVLPPPHPLVTSDLGLRAGFGLTGPSVRSFTMCRGRTEAPCDLMFDGDSASFSSVVRARVGDTMGITGSLDAFVGISIGSAEPFTFFGGEARFDTGTEGARTYLTPASNDVFLVAQSGTNYAAPIPEPTTYAQVLAGFMLMILATGRRRTRARRN